MINLYLTLGLSIFILPLLIILAVLGLVLWTITSLYNALNNDFDNEDDDDSSSNKTR